MGLLNNFFSSTESIAKEIQADEESIIKHWKDYLGTVSRKEEIISKLSLINLQSSLYKLKKLLKLELVDISGEEKEESELISDLEVIKHSQNVRKLHKLEQCIGYAETKYEYVHELLLHLHPILKSQMHLVEKMQTGSEDAEKLLSHLKLQFELELEIINQIGVMGTFHDLFLALVRGEHIIKGMDSKEKKLLKKMQKGMDAISIDEKTEGITSEWAETVFKAIKSKTEEAYNKGILGGHKDSNYEFVNGPGFVDLVRESIQKLKKRKVSEQMINVFVHVFRKWYNSIENNVAPVFFRWHDERE